MKGKVKGRLNRIFIILMCAMLAVCPVMTETVSAANTSKSNTTAKKRLSGWVTVQRGQVRYYRAGTYYKGCKRIGNYYYYFDSRGILLKKDTTVRGVTYYIESNGRVLGRCLVISSVLCVVLSLVGFYGIVEAGQHVHAQYFAEAPRASDERDLGFSGVQKIADQACLIHIVPALASNLCKVRRSDR